MNRGYYFDGTGTTRMNFNDDFALNVAFTVSAWINSGTAAHRVIFSKDDNQADPTTVFVFKIQEDHNLAVEITTPGDFATRETKAGITPLVTDTWLFIAAGVSLNSDALTADVKIYHQSEDSTLTTTSGYYYLDDATAYKAVLGAERTTDQNTYGNLFTGFMYGIWIENVYQTGTRTQIYSGGSCTAADCLVTSSDGVVNFPFNQAADGTACGSTCAGKSCVNGLECQACSWPHCHLCPDRECEECTGYSTANCTNCGTGASQGSGDCTCTAGHHRSEITHECLACHTDCNACTTGGLTNYSDCTTCNGSGVQGLPISGTSVVYCVSFCPYPQTANGAICDNGSLGTVVEAKFNNFGADWSSNGFNLTRNNVVAAKNRGHYFATSTPGRIEISSSPKFNIDLTISSWIRLDVLDSTNAIFAHDKDEPGVPLQILNFSVTSSGNLQVLIGNSSNSYNESETVESSATVPATDWKFVAASIQLREDAISSRVTFNIDDTEEAAQDT